jgi:glycosyltransferase involved in cell wall biosynthesis
MNEPPLETAAPQLSVILLTHNEEANLPACLESLRGLACELFVVDSGSTDRTVEIAQAAGATVVEHPFETHTQQWTWVLQHAPIATTWVLALDADQRLIPALRDELAALFARQENVEGIDGFYLNRRQVFRGKWIRYGGYYPKYLLKLFRRSKVRTDRNDLADHHFYVEGRVRKLQHDLIEENKKEDNIAFWIEKHERYATLLACEEWQRRHENLQTPVAPALLGTPDQRILWLKRLWSHFPLYVRPFLYFVYRYICRVGFLDGKEGFIFHFLQAFWFRLLVDIKLEEMARAKTNDQLSSVPDSQP